MENFYTAPWRLCAFALFLMLPHIPLKGQTLLSSEGFETNGEGTRYTSNTYTDCASEQDVFFRTNTNPVTPPSCAAIFGTTLTNVQGSFFWACEDIRTSTPTPLSRPPGSIVSNSINITSYGSLTMRLHVATSANNNARWESADSINLKASINGGPFRTIGRIMGKGAPLVGGNLGIDSDLDGAITGADPIANLDVANFTQYTFNIPGTGSTLRWSLDFDQAGGSEELAIDQIEIRGTVIVPVKWASFSGHPIDEKVKLDWATTEEVNVREFEIERLAGDGSYALIGTIGAAGIPSSYGFVDPNPAAGVNIYRIKQIDADNAFSYSESIEVTVNPTFQTVLYPNPMHDGCRLAIEGEPATGMLHVLDNAGRKLRSLAFEDANEIVIAREGLSQGIYHLRIDLATGRSFTKKMLVRD